MSSKAEKRAAAASAAIARAAAGAERTRLESLMFEAPPCPGCCDPECPTSKARVKAAEEAAAKAAKAAPLASPASTATAAAAATTTAVGPAAGLKKCSSCWRLLSESEYSGAQLKLKGRRTCKLCLSDWCQICGEGEDAPVPIAADLFARARAAGADATLGPLRQLQILQPPGGPPDLWITTHPMCTATLGGQVHHPTPGGSYPHTIMTGASLPALELLQEECAFCRRRGAMFQCARCARGMHMGCAFNHDPPSTSSRCHMCAAEKHPEFDAKQKDKGAKPATPAPPAAAAAAPGPAKPAASAKPTASAKPATSTKPTALAKPAAAPASTGFFSGAAAAVSAAVSSAASAAASAVAAVTSPRSSPVEVVFSAEELVTAMAARPVKASSSAAPASSSTVPLVDCNACGLTLPASDFSPDQLCDDDMRSCSGCLARGCAVCGVVDTSLFLTRARIVKPKGAAATAAPSLDVHIHGGCIQTLLDKLEAVPKGGEGKGEGKGEGEGAAHPCREERAPHISMDGLPAPLYVLLSGCCAACSRPGSVSGCRACLATYHSACARSSLARSGAPWPKVIVGTALARCDLCSSETKQNAPDGKATAAAAAMPAASTSAAASASAPAAAATATAPPAAAEPVAGLKKCAGCARMLPESDYSGVQLKAKGKRQCKACVAGESTSASSSAASAASAAAAATATKPTASSKPASSKMTAPARIRFMTRLPNLVARLRSGSEANQLESAGHLRDLFKDADDDLLLSAVDAGVIPRLLQLLQTSRSVPLQLECAWCLSHLAAGESAALVGALVSSGALAVLVGKVRAPGVSAALQEKCLWVVANISEQVEGAAANKRAIVETGVLPTLLALAAPSTPLNIVSVVGWLLYNLTCGAPAPRWSDLSAIVRAVGTILLRRSTAASAGANAATENTLLCDCLNALQAAIEAPMRPRKCTDSSGTPAAAGGKGHADSDAADTEEEDEDEEDEDAEYEDEEEEEDEEVEDAEDDAADDTVCVHVRIGGVLNAAPGLPLRVLELLGHSDREVVTAALQLLSAVLENGSQAQEATLLAGGMVSKLVPLLSHKLACLRSLACLVLSKVAYGFPEHARALLAHPKAVQKLVLMLGLETVPAVTTEVCYVLSAIAAHAHKSDEAAKNASGSPTASTTTSSTTTTSTTTTTTTTTTITTSTTTTAAAAADSDTKEDGGAATTGQKGDDGDSGSDSDAAKDDCRDLVRTLVDDRKVIAPLIMLLRQSKQRGQYNVMRVATEVLGHILDAGIVESEFDERGVNPYIEPIDWLGAFELWHAERDNAKDPELAKEAARLYDTFFIPNTCD